MIRGGNGDANEELSEVTKKVAAKLEDACSGVLKDDLEDAEKWIAEQQQNIFEQISSTQKAIQTTRQALETAGTFSASEIDTQIAGIIAKETNLKKRMEDFEALKDRAGDIYKADKMDEE